MASSGTDVWKFGNGETWFALTEDGPEGRPMLEYHGVGVIAGATIPDEDCLRLIAALASNLARRIGRPQTVSGGQAQSA